jgi:SOS response regulatory protein OraA/RecX
LEYSRAVTGAKKESIKISDKEWEAIQAGAISDTKMQEILANTDIDKLRERAMPRTTTGMTDAKVARAESMLDRGYSWEEVASSLGVSVSTVQRALENK